MMLKLLFFKHILGVTYFRVYGSDFLIKYIFKMENLMQLILKMNLKCIYNLLTNAWTLKIL